MIRTLLLIVTSLATLGSAAAQTTRFPGDSPNTNNTFTPGRGGNYRGGTPGSSYRVNVSGYAYGYGYPIGGYYYDGHSGVGSPYGSSYYGGGSSYYGGPSYYGGGDPYYYGDSGYYAPTLCPGCGFPYGQCRCGVPLVLPPVILDPSEMYGPRAVQRVMGVNPSASPPPMTRLERRQQAQAIASAAAAVPRAAATRPVGNNDSRGRAWKYIEYGDRYLKEGKFRDAVTRYRKAATADANLADARFRQGLAELAAGRYDQAVTAIQRGLAIDPNWPHGNFVLEDVFDDGLKLNIEQSLRARLTLNPNDANARFLLGVVRHFDGRPEEAQREFQQVDKLTGGAEHARAFLTRKPSPDEGKIKP